ncbi:MAG: hypothetical protein KDK27_04325, partial [Leptospiraceae bacterium]|nr:hypothetical protein [Leptospiraceae bacterium]
MRRNSLFFTIVRNLLRYVAPGRICLWAALALAIQIQCIQSYPDAFDSESLLLLLSDDSEQSSSPGVTITPTGGSIAVSESGTTDSYSVVLNTRPTDSVTVDIGFDTTQLTINSQSTTPQSLTFSTSNWNVSQTVTVAAVDDGALEGTPHTSTINHASSSSDSNYSGISVSSLSADITDNDSPGVAITESSGSTTATEALTDTYTIALTSSPTAQ